MNSAGNEISGSAQIGLASGVGEAARHARAEQLDEWLISLFPSDPGPGIALVAVGGLGRRECAPFSDLDLVILHDGHPEADEIGTAIWYQVWDAKRALDHSTRSLDEAVEVSDADLKAALGLLDARHLAGDPTLVERLHATVLRRWRMAARKRLPELHELTVRRWRANGELAFLLEGDVKESRGGLRDFSDLRGIGFAGVAEGTRPVVRAGHRLLLDVRDALHVVRGRRVDRLLAQDREEVARLLDLADGDEVLRRIAEAARTVSYATDDAWRSANRWVVGRQRGATRRPIARDVVESHGEIVLARAAVTPQPDPSLALRVAAAAARNELPIARATLEWLSAFTPSMPEPWSASARNALVRLLGSGPGLVPVWEAFDRYGLVTKWLPEFARIRSLPQHNPVHRFTVDRHQVETAKRAGLLTRQVDRPDLLLIAALLHDIAKGMPGDHSVVGAPIAGQIALRMGLDVADAAVVERAVRLHLLLPDTATRRDIADPVTIKAVADAVGDAQLLHLLHALSRADAGATGPGAWSTWKGRLIAELVGQVAEALDTGVVPEPLTTVTPSTVRPLPVIEVARDRVSVTAPDRPGLLADVAGCLALHRLDVVTADTDGVDGVGIVSCAVQPRYGGQVDAEALTVDLRRAVRGELDLARRLGARDGSRRNGRDPEAPIVRWQPATGAAVLELRAADSAGLLYRVARALGDAGVNVRCARISTLGADVVDAFYLWGDWSDIARRQPVEQAVVAAVLG